MPIKHYKISQAFVISTFTLIVGQLVAFIPSMGPDKQNLISGGSALIAAAFVIGNGLHALASSKVTSGDLAGGVRTLVQDEVSRIDFNGILKDAASGGLPGVEQAVRVELSKLLGQAAAAAPVAAPPAVPAAVMTPAAPAPTA